MEPSVFQPKIVAFCCHYCAYSSADLAGSMRIQYPPNVRIIRTPCTGRLETEYFMKAFENGADGVLVAGCLEGGCHFVEGNLCAKRRVNYTRDLLMEQTGSAWSIFPPPWLDLWRTSSPTWWKPSANWARTQSNTTVRQNRRTTHDRRTKKKHP
jgi:hypothetical protein